jgi:energy-coupling factor transporter ATP-binding protein EcfA2
MKEKFQEIYKTKAAYYLEVIEELENNNTPYFLLNYLIPDDKPGDLDILIEEVNLKQIEVILKEKGFFYYTDFTTDQIIWNKYVSNIGFIQFHLYIGLSFKGKQIFPNIPKINLPKNALNFSFFIFFIESFFRKNYKKDIFDKYLIQTSVLDLRKFVKTYFPETINIIDYVNIFYDKSSKFSKIKYIKVLFSFNKHFLLKYYLTKTFKVLRRVNNKDDSYVLFLGTDGSGKTTLLNNIKTITSKGGYFSIVKYFGLRVSVINKISTRFNRVFKTRKVNQTECKTHDEKCGKRKKIGIINYIKVIVYWIEYNLRFLFEIKLRPNSAKTIYLLDRSFVDLIFFYQNRFTEALFIKYSFQPTSVIILSGDASVFYNRNQEYEIDVIKKYNNFYNNLNTIYKKKRVSSLVLDSSTLDEKQCVSNSMDYIVH